jgi:hypothetical protein
MTDLEKDAAVRRLVDRLWGFPVEDYLASENFVRFCQEYELGDAWGEYLQLSRDTPDLYGNSVIKHAFILFLRHIAHRRQEEFPLLFFRLLKDFSLGISCALPFEALKTDLVHMGFAEREIKEEFSLVFRRAENPGNIPPGRPAP